MIIINAGDNVIDSRHVNDRIEELENEIGDMIESYMEENELGELADEDIPEDSIIWELKEELRPLTELKDEANGSPDWEYGEILIHEDYFTEYCKELIKDMGDLPQDVPSYITIDWENTADNLKVDYMKVIFDDETYFIRA